MNNTTSQLEVAPLNIDATRLRPKQVSIAKLFDAQLATCKKLCDKSSAAQVGKLNNTTSQLEVTHMNLDVANMNIEVAPLNIDMTRLRPKQVSIATLFDAQLATCKKLFNKSSAAQVGKLNNTTSQLEVAPLNIDTTRTLPKTG